MLPTLETVATACGEAIADDATLEIYQRTLNAFELEITNLETKANLAIQAIKDEQAERTAPLQEQLDALRATYEPSVKAFVQGKLAAAGGTSKTYKTPWGAYSFKTTGGGLEIQDAVQVLNWALTEHPELVHRPMPKPVAPSVQISALKPWFETNQVVPPGCAKKPSVQAFSYKAED